MATPQDILRLYKALLRAGGLVQSISAALPKPRAPSQAPLPFNFAAVAAAPPSPEGDAPAPDAQLSLVRPEACQCEALWQSGMGWWCIYSWGAWYVQAQLQGLARALACPAAPVSRPKRGAWERLAAEKRECALATRLGACRQVSHFHRARATSRVCAVLAESAAVPQRCSCAATDSY